MATKVQPKTTDNQAQANSPPYSNPARQLGKGSLAQRRSSHARAASDTSSSHQTGWPTGSPGID
jgi:hypothetical protein